MPSLGLRCFELRVHDDGKAWRLLIRIDSDAVVVTDVFQKTTRVTPVRVITDARKRLRGYDTEANGYVRAEKKRRIRAAGWRAGSVRDFLGLTDVEEALVEMKVTLAAE